MAIEESRRENLLLDATAYGTRIRFRSTEDLESEHANEKALPWSEVFFGFRQEGGWSIYFDESPVFQFNATGGLRRVYEAGERLEASGGNLVQLVREQRGGKVQLIRQPLTSEQCTQRCKAIRENLNFALSAIENSVFEMDGCFPANFNPKEAVSLVRDSLRRVLGEQANGRLLIARGPHAHGGHQ